MVLCVVRGAALLPAGGCEAALAALRAKPDLSGGAPRGRPRPMPIGLALSWPGSPVADSRSIRAAVRRGLQNNVAFAGARTNAAL